MDTKHTTIDAYLAAVPDDARVTLSTLRETIARLVPDAVESISYGIPTFKYRGRPLIYFGAAKQHCAIYGTSKGTVRFPPGDLIPEAFVKPLLDERIATINAASTSGKRGTSGYGKSK